jgi:hypothetical protein
MSIQKKGIFLFKLILICIFLADVKRIKNEQGDEEIEREDEEMKKIKEEKDKEIRKKDMEIERIKKENKKKDEEIKKKDEILKKKDEEIKEKDETLKKKDEEIRRIKVEKDEIIKKKDEEIKRLKEEKQSNTQQIPEFDINNLGNSVTSGNYNYYYPIDDFNTNDLLEDEVIYMTEFAKKFPNDTAFLQSRKLHITLIRMVCNVIVLCILIVCMLDLGEQKK